MKHEDFSDSKLEVALHLLGLFFVDFEHRSELAYIAACCCPWIVNNSLVEFLANKLGSLIFACEIFGSNDSLLYSHTTFEMSAVFVELCERTFNKCCLVNNLAGELFAKATCESLVLAVNHLFGYIDVVIRNLVVGIESYIDYRRQSD